MIRLIITLLLASIFSLPADANWQSRDSNYNVNIVAAGGGYVGVADVVASPAIVWSMRCADTAYSGNVADIWDAATGNTIETLLTCSAGGTINETIHPLATTCAVACNIKTLYAQIGQTACVGNAACDVTQAVNSARPTYTTINGHGCMAFSAASSQQLLSIAPLAQAQPFTFSIVSGTTAYTATVQIAFAEDGTSGAFMGYQTTAYNFTFTATSAYSGYINASGSTVNGGTLYAFMGVYNGNNAGALQSNLYVNGGSNANTTMGTGGLLASGNWTIGSSINQNYLTGNVCEVAVWYQANTQANATALSTNQLAWW